MNRKQIIDFINNEILPKVSNRWTWKEISSGKELIKMVSDYRSKQIKAGKANINDKYIASIVDGYLYINNEPVGRIAPKDHRPQFDETSYYYEGKILARQEALYND